MNKPLSQDGRFLPKRLTKEFLESAQKTMGVNIFANQYLIVIPDDKKTFKKEWIKYYDTAQISHTALLQLTLQCIYR